MYTCVLCVVAAMAPPRLKTLCWNLHRSEITDFMEMKRLTVARWATS